MSEKPGLSDMTREILPETDYLGYRLLDRETDPDRFKAAIVEYFRHFYSAYQIQSWVKALTAAEDYLRLMTELGTHEDELACLFRTGFHGEMAEGHRGYMFHHPIEDLTVFRIDNPILAIAKIPDGGIALERGYAGKHIDGIILLQPLIGYTRRSDATEARSRVIFSESQGFPTAGERHRFDPHYKDGLGKICLSWIEVGPYHQISISHPIANPRGLEYACSGVRFPSIAYSPTRWERHMRLVVGDEATVQALREQPVEPCPDSQLARLIKFGCLDNNHHLPEAS